MQRCTICNTNINNEEDVIFPLAKKNIPGFIWAHYSCILDIVGNLKDGEIPTFKCKTVCKHWKKKDIVPFVKVVFSPIHQMKDLIKKTYHIIKKSV